MTDLSKAELKKRWGTMQKVVSSEPRAKQIVDDILLDMETKPRLMDGRGNAMLVGASIYQACKFYELFVPGRLQGQVRHRHLLRAATPATSQGGRRRGRRPRSCASTTSTARCWPTTSTSPPTRRWRKVEQFEKEVKEQFVDEPGQMRLLIVVDKLLTGFDAPTATYLYIDKKMRDHGLFQAICRVNRLDGDDKDYGYIVDYQDLFNSLETAITDYTTGALDGYEKKDIEGLLSDRIEKAREDLDEALETDPRALRAGRAAEGHAAVPALLLSPPSTATPSSSRPTSRSASSSTRPSRRSSAPTATSPTRWSAAGYSDAEAAAIKDEVAHYAAVRDEVKLGAGEDVDFKQYEAGMRYLLDTYIQADAVETVADFEDTGLVELIVERGAGAIDKLPEGSRRTPRPSPRRSPTTCAR